jgi:hypothetical protein
MVLTRSMTSERSDDLDKGNAPRGLRYVLCSTEYILWLSCISEPQALRQLIQVPVVSGVILILENNGLYP